MGNSTGHRLSDLTNDEERLRKRRKNGPGVPQKCQNRRKNGAECGESATGPGGLPRARTLREFLLRSARIGIQCTRVAAQEGTEPGNRERQPS